MSKKYLYTLLLSPLCAHNAEAQSIKPKLQLEAGAGLTNITIVGETNSESATARGKATFYPTYGGSLDLQLDKNNSIEIGAYRFVGGGTLFKRNLYKEYIKLSYVRFPVNYKVKIQAGNRKANVFFTAGAYFAYLVKGQMTVSGIPYIVHTGDYKIFDRFDMGLSASVGYMTPPGIYFKGMFSVGLHNTNDQYDSTMPYRESTYNRPNAAFVMGVQF